MENTRCEGGQSALQAWSRHMLSARSTCCGKSLLAALESELCSGPAHHPLEGRARLHIFL